MGTTRTRSEAHPQPTRSASRRPTGSPSGSANAASSMDGWVQNARKGSESARTIREMSAMLELTSELLDARTPAAAVRSVVQISFTHLHVPLVGVLPDRSGAGWFVAAARGVGVRRGDIVRSIEGVSALQRGRSTRSRLAARLARTSGRDRAEAIGAEPAVLLALDMRADHRPFLRTAASLLSESLGRLDKMAWAEMRNDHLDLALAWTAHELRGPLVGARAALGHVLVDDQGSESDELLQQTKVELDQLAELVGPLLRWSAGSGSLRKRQADLVRVVDDAIASCRMEFDHADLVIQVPDALPIRADATQLRGAIGNVIRNALCYAPPGTSVAVDVSADSESARVRVRDRGPGIPVSERHLIFDPFARGALADETRCGKGLGLFIARRILEAHGGSISVRSARPGTEFCIELPLPTNGRLRSAS